MLIGAIGFHQRNIDDDDERQMNLLQRRVDLMTRTIRERKQSIVRRFSFSSSTVDLELIA